MSESNRKGCDVAVDRGDAMNVARHRYYNDRSATARNHSQGNLIKPGGVKCQPRLLRVKLIRRKDGQEFDSKQGEL